MRSWQLQQAKARLSELVGAAQREGPQEITLHGKPAVLVLSLRDYQELTGGKPSFVEFISKSPLAGIELQIEREESAVREVQL